MKSQFLLDPKITFLNHGSFGACPKPIFEEYQRLQLELENEPVFFIQKKQAEYLKIAKEKFAKYVGCKANDFFFTPNPTFAINTIMRSLDLKVDDEILSTNHEYGATRRRPRARAGRSPPNTSKPLRSPRCRRRRGSRWPRPSRLAA